MRKWAALASVIMTVTFLSGAAERAWGGAGARVHLAATEGLVPLEQVLAMLRKRYSGDQLDARIVRNPGVALYEIQWLTREGRKIVFIVNAHDGKIIATRGLESDANPGR